MRLHLDGTEIFNLPRDRVFQILTDVGFIAKLVSDSSNVSARNGNTVEARIRIKALPLLTISAKVKMVSVEYARRARLEVSGGGARSHLSIRSDFDLEGENPTRMRWIADAEITGQMARLGYPKVRRITERTVKKILEGLRKSISEG